MDKASPTVTELICIAECALGLLAVAKSARKNSKEELLRLHGSVTTKYVVTVCRRREWISLSDHARGYDDDRFYAIPLELTATGRCLLASAPYPACILSKEELTVKEAADILGVSRSRVAQILSANRVPSTAKFGKCFVRTKDLYAVWLAKRSKRLKIALQRGSGKLELQRE